MQSEDFFGMTLFIREDVKYCGEGESPDSNPFFNLWKKSYEETYKDDDSGE